MAALCTEVCGVIQEDLNIGGGWNGLGTMGSETGVLWKCVGTEGVAHTGVA